MRIYKFIAAFICITIILLCIPPARQAIGRGVWNLIIEQWDREEQARLKKLENGDIVRGKDTILIWENRYEIWHNYDGNHLLFKDDNQMEYTVLSNVQKNKVVKKKLYVISGEGFAIIDKNRLCRVYLNVLDDSENNDIKQLIEDDHIQYLSDFNDFSEKEKEVFNGM